MSETPIPFFAFGGKSAGAAWFSALLRNYADCAVIPSGDLNFFDLRYGQCDARQYYLSRSARLQHLARSVARSMLDPLREMDNATSSGNDQCDIDGPDSYPDESDEAAEADPVDSATTVAWTDEVRRNFFRAAGVDSDLREIRDIIAQLSICDSQSYARYMARRVKGAKAFGEIAPGYASLPATAFAELDSLFPGARFVFIMQDPVAHLCSHIRIGLERAQRRGRREIDCKREFRRVLDRSEIVELSSYQNTIRNLESVVPSRRILYLFQERMISPHTGHDEIRRIESILGLARSEIDDTLFEDATSASPAVELDRADLADARRMFFPVYRFVQDRFGEASGWKFPASLSRPKAGSRR